MSYSLLLLDGRKGVGMRDGAAILQQLPRAAVLIGVFEAADRVEEHGDEVLGLVRRLHRNHLVGWEGEDVCRDEADDRRVAAAKRRTDVNNAARIQLIERIDAWLAERLPDQPNAPLHTETLGSVVDRLGIAWVRVHHLRRRSLDGGKATPDEVKMAEWQLEQLGAAYDTLLEEVAAGRRRVPYWRVLKSYGER